MAKLSWLMQAAGAAALFVAGCTGAASSDERGDAKVALPKPIKFTHDGLKRQYRVLAPLAAREPRPIVVLLHGGTLNGRQIWENSSWPSWMRRAGWVQVVPDAIEGTWNDGRTIFVGRRTPDVLADDVAFLDALIDRAVEQHGGDRRRVFMTGPSNGGNMSFYYACRRPGRLTAIAPVIASMQKSVAQGCLARDPLPVHLTASTDDPLLPFEGGTTSPYAKQRGTTFEERLSVPDSIAFWARINRCNGAPVETGLRDRDSRDGTTVTRIAYRGCAAPTELYRVNSGGHQVPRYTATAKREQLVERLLGKQSHDIDQEEEAQAFFRAAVRR